MHVKNSKKIERINVRVIFYLHVVISYFESESNCMSQFTVSELGLAPLHGLMALVPEIQVSSLIFTLINIWIVGAAAESKLRPST